jgi:hypothetical protein
MSLCLSARKFRFRRRNWRPLSVLWAEVGALGRNINQIARTVNQQQWPTGPNRSDLMAIRKSTRRFERPLQSCYQGELGCRVQEDRSLIFRIDVDIFEHEG